jgi:hypothetical protein
MDFALMFAYFLPLGVIVFLTRALFRMRHPKVRGSDALFHLHVSEEIRNNHYRMPDTINGFIIETPFDYPALVHFFLAFASKKRREKIEPYFGPVIDTFQALVLFVFGLYLTNSYEVSLLSGFLFAFFPLLVKTDSRVYFLSPRPFGELFLSMAIIFSLHFVWFSNPGSVLLALFFLSIVFLSSKFGVQAALFLHVIMSILLLTFLPILIFFGGLLVAIAISRGYYLKLLRGQIRHSIYFRRIGVGRHSWTRQVSGFEGIKVAFRTRDFKKMAVTLLKNPVVYVFSYAPLLFMLFVLLAVRFDVIMNDFILRSLLIWSLASLGAVLLVSTKPLRFLGEAERYLEYGVVPICLFVSMVMFQAGAQYLWVILTLVVAYSIVFMALNYRLSVVEFTERPPSISDTSEIMAKLNTIPISRIICIPTQTSYDIAYFTDHKSLYWGGNIPLDPFSTTEFIIIFKDEYPFPNPDLGLLIKKYRIDRIIFWKDSMSRAPPGYEYDFIPYDVEYENASYILYSVPTSVS